MVAGNGENRQLQSPDQRCQVRVGAPAVVLHEIARQGNEVCAPFGTLHVFENTLQGRIGHRAAQRRSRDLRTNADQ